MSAIRTQVYLTREQREGLDRHARSERTTMAHLIREAVDRYLSADLDDAERERAIAETYGSRPRFGGQVPSRDEWSAR